MGVGSIDRKEVVKLSKIFRISGNFTYNGEWVDPDPAFSGEIVVDETGKFCGWCEQLYAESAAQNGKEISEDNRFRCLVGAVAKEGKGYSLLFFKLSNNDQQTPLSYEIHNVSLADCVWMTKDPGPDGGFVPQGNARVWLEELPYSEEAANRIKERFYKVDKDAGSNRRLIEEALSWQKKNLVLWA